MKNKSVAEIVEETILSGRDSKFLKAMRRDPWENPEVGTEFLFGLSHSMGHPKSPNSSQKKLLELCVRRLRETSLRILPEQLIQIARFFKELAAKENKLGRKINLTLFHTKEGEIKEAIAIVKSIIEARYMLPPYADLESSDAEDEANVHAGLIGIFNMIVWGTLDDCTWRNFTKGLELAEKDALETFILLEYNIKRNQELCFTSYDKFQKYKAENLLDGDSKSPVRIPIPNIDAAEKIAENLSREMDRVDELCRSFADIVEWFKNHEEDFAFLEKEMWEDIKLRPKYGLRSNGRDRVKLDIVPGNDYISIDSIQFFPQQFPKTDVKIWRKWRGKKESSTLHLYPEFSFSNWNGGNNDISSSKMLYFVTLQCYWEIVMGKSSEVSEEEAKTSTARVSVSDRDRMRERLSHVRPFFRKLPEGQHYSEKALGLAQQALGYLIMPDGKTFVREHDRGWQEMEEIAPLFTYSAQDIKSWA